MRPALVLLLCAPLLVGCQAAQHPDPVMGPAPAAQVAQGHVEAPTLVVGSQVAPDTPLPLSQKAFPMLDGTLLVVDRHQPVPAEIEALVQEQASLIRYSPYTGMNSSELYDQARALEASVNLMLGKNLQVVYRLVNTPSCNDSGSDPWSFMGATNDKFGGCAQWSSKEDALKAAQSWIDDRYDADEWMLVSTSG